MKAQEKNENKTTCLSLICCSNKFGLNSLRAGSSFWANFDANTNEYTNSNKYTNGHSYTDSRSSYL